MQNVGVLTNHTRWMELIEGLPQSSGGGHVLALLCLIDIMLFVLNLNC